jgi:simple sugar transport system substrate-binding protein
MQQSFAQRWWAARVVAVASVAALLAACGSASDDNGDGAGGSASGDAPTFIYLRDVPQPAPFDEPIVQGYETAGEQLGADVVFEGAPADSRASDPDQERRMLENAITEDPDCLIVTFDNPSAQGPGVEAAIEAGIPVVFANAGYGEAEEYGALTYIGSDEALQGEEGARQLAELGVEHPLVVTLAPGALPLTDQRNAGFEGEFAGDISWLYVSLADAAGSATSIAGSIEAELASDPSIDAVFTAGVVLAPAALAAYSDLGSRAPDLTWATIDTSEQILGAIEAGELAFALDQQQYLQGYWAALVCDQYVRYGLEPVDPVMATGPILVTQDNLAGFQEAASEGIH